MALTSLGLLLLLSSLLYGQTEEIPEAVLKLEPNRSLIYTGETVTLSCEIKEGHVSDWKYIWRQNDSDIMTDSGESSYIISSVELHHGGDYACIGTRLRDSLHSEWSSSVTLTVQALPTAKVKRVSPQGAVYPRDTVTLQCDIPEHEDWSYTWFKGEQPLSNENKKTITLYPDAAGSYTCEGSRRDRPTKSQFSDYHSVTITATMTIEQNPVYTGETVTLRCSAGPSSDWRYTWFKSSTETATGSEVVKSSRHTIYGDTLTISEATHPDQGYYKCYGHHSLTLVNTLSSFASYLAVEVVPTATVRRSRFQGAVYPGDKVTLQCDIPKFKDWSYKWFKNKQPLTNKNKKAITLHADAAGLYSCEGSRRDRPKKSHLSDNHSVTITALPVATLAVTPTPAFTGETVTLKCTVMDPHIGWRYKWFKGSTDREVTSSGRYGIDGDTLTIREAKHSDQDAYRCQGQRLTSPRSSIKSNSVTFSLNDSKPRANMMSFKTAAVFTGDTVTLTCSVGESSGWKFYWYRHSTGSDPLSESTEGLYTLTPSSVSEGGEFWCRGGRGDPVYYTEYSQPISINVTARPYAVLTLQPNWTQIYIGETVTIKCEIKGTDDFKGWEYSLNKGSYPVGTIESEYKFNPTNIERVEFTCKGDSDSVHSKISEPLRLTVSGKPQPILSVSPSWLNPGDSVTLTCEVEVSSTDWRFYWYRAVPYQTELPSLADQSYSVEPLLDSGHGTRESSYILHGATHTAGYVCRAGRGRPVYHSHYSKPQFLWSGDQHPSAFLTVKTNRSQHFTAQSVSLSCEGNTTRWKVKRSTTNGLSDCLSSSRSMIGHTCSLGNFYTGLSGVYWCESGSGEYSNAVNITLTYGEVILESPVHPVTEGDSVTLRCKHRNPSPVSKVDFYKDGGLIQNGTSGEMTIPAVSKSHEGLYRCRYSDREESPESWLVVRGSSSSGLVVGLVVTGILLALLFILIFLLCKQYNGLCFGKTSRSMPSRETNQSQCLDLGANQNQTSDDRQYSALQKRGDDVYETIKVPDINHQGGAAAGPSDVTYCQIRLKNLGKKKIKKERRADPAEDTVYSDIRPSAAPGEAAENQHLIYSLLEFKKKKSKTGKKSSTPAPAGCVCAEVKPGSTSGPTQR